MNSDAVFDCLVLGLGPAGSSFLRLAPPSLRLAALSAPPGPLGKPCGGLLSPDAQAQLARQGLNLPKELLVSPQIFAVHTLDLGSGRSRHYQRSYVNMDRARFDAWLLSLVPERVQRFQGRAQQIRRLENGLFQVEYRNARAERGRLWARRLVGADGAASLVRSSLFPGRQARGFASIQQWFPQAQSTPFYACIFDAETSPACSWAVSKDGMLLFGGAFPQSGCRARFERQKQKLLALGWELSQPRHTQACRVLCPKTPMDFCLGGGDAYLLGEAAGFISPSSLEGISWALRSAEALARAFSQADPLDAYARATLGLRLELLAKRGKRPFMYHPLLRDLVLRSGLSSLSLLECPR